MPIEQFLQYAIMAFISARQASSQVCQLTTLFGIVVGFISYEEIHVACTQFIWRQGSLWHEAQSGYVLKKKLDRLKPNLPQGEKMQRSFDLPEKTAHLALTDQYPTAVSGGEKAAPLGESGGTVSL